MNGFKDWIIDKSIIYFMYYGNWQKNIFTGLNISKC